MLPYQNISRKEDGIAIIGLGGAGANILQCFGGSSADNVRLCIMSLDERVGRGCGNVEFIQLGSGLNRGLGSGGDPDVGASAAEESRTRIAELLGSARLLVLVAGLGGGTGSGAAPVLAQMAREAGLFLVSVLVMPFGFEGRRRRAQAEKALEQVASLSDIVFCFENDYMEDLFRNRSGARAVFEEVDRLLAKATASVPTLANSPGLINLGLDELAAALENNDSRCIFGSGSGYGPHRAEDAARAALESPLVSYHGALRFARTVIVHIAGGDTMSLTEIRRCMETVQAALANEDVRLFFGTTVKPKLGDEIRVSLIASVDGEEMKAVVAAEEAQKDAPAPAPEPDLPAEAHEEEDTDEPADEAEEADEPAPAAYATEAEGDDDGEGESLFDADEDERLTPLPEGEHDEAERLATINRFTANEEEPATTPYRPETPSRPPMQGQLFSQDFAPAAEPPAPRRSFAPTPAAPPEEEEDDSPRYSPEAAYNRMHPLSGDDDIDTPPSLRTRHRSPNDLRDML